jgi:hypothetical protein
MRSPSFIFLGKSGFYMLGIEGKEISLHRKTDFHQQVGADALTAKDVVDIGAVAIEMLRKPHHATTLAKQFVMNLFTNMNACFPHQLSSICHYLWQK